MGGKIKRIEATSEDILNLARFHLKEKLPLSRMATEMGRSLMWCTRTLKEAGLYVGADGSDEEKDRKWNHGNPIITAPKPFFKEGIEYVAVCKATGKEFDDFRNTSGALTTHLRKLRVPMADQSDFKKKKFQTEQGRPWFVDHFEFIQPKPKEKRKHQYQPRAEITETQFAAIKKGYLEDGLSMRALEKSVGMSSSLIHRVLLEWDMFVPFPPLKNWPNKHERLEEHRRLRSEKTKKNIRFDKKGAPSFFEEGKDYVAVCKQTGKRFSDYMNASGIITRHLEQIMPDMKHETNTKKREFFKTTGRPWYHEHFDFHETKIVVKEKRKCAYCDWTTNDLTNASGWYTVHLRSAHNFDVHQHVKQFPDESHLFATELKRRSHNEWVKSDPSRRISCKVCGEEMKKITETHLQKHGMTLSDYRARFIKTMSDETAIKFKELYENNLKHLGSSFTSAAQTEIADMLKELGLEVLMNDKKTLSGVELDIYVPSLNLAIEYNGIYYHSEIGGKKDRMYHLKKTELCIDKNISLIHVFEDDWTLKKDIWISRIKHMMGMGVTKKVHARSCVIMRIDSVTKNRFLNKNHLQGQDNSMIAYGAFNEGALIAVITFDDKRVMTSGIDEGTFELTRFCTSMSTRCAGIMSKMMRVFIKEMNPKKIISFADRSYIMGTNNIYEKMGFILEKVLPPDFKYVNRKSHNLKRLHKFQFGKSSIAKKFPNIYHPEKTEWQMMQEAGFDRIWDCGKFRYVLYPK